jgi:hypothetical protein
MGKIFVAICIIYAVLSVLKNYVLVGMSKLLIIPLAVSAISFLAFYIKLVIATDMKKAKVEEDKERREIKKSKKEEQKQALLKEYDTNVKPLYNEGKNLFSTLVKQGKLRKYEIKELKKIINDSLGANSEFYHNYKFKNDAHEIYVKMMNFNLNEYDWNRIIDYLHDKEDNECIKKKKKLVTN